MANQWQIPDALMVDHQTLAVYCWRSGAFGNLAHHAAALNTE